MDDFKVISEKFNFGGELSLRVFFNDSRENFQCAEDQAPIRQKMTMCQKVQSHASCQGHTQVSLDTFQDLFPLYCIFWLFMKSKKTRSTEFLKKICFVFSFDCNGPIKKALIKHLAIILTKTDYPLGHPTTRFLRLFFCFRT